MDSDFKLVRWSEGGFQENAWDTIVKDSDNGTLLHMRSFLSYHGDRFAEQIEDFGVLRRGKLIGVLRLGVENRDQTRIARAPIGSSFGGPVTRHRLELHDTEMLCGALRELVEREGWDRMHIRFAPDCYSKNSDETLEYSLIRNGFQPVDWEVSTVIKLEHDQDAQWRRIKARYRNVISKSGKDWKVMNDVSVEEFYPILLEDKERHDNAKPTHTLAELKLLKERFPEQIKMDVGVHEDGSRAGICYFELTPTIAMTFYLSQEDEAVGKNGVRVLLWDGLKRYVDGRFEYLDLGTSTIGLEIQNIGVSRFKETFGAVSYLRRAFEFSADAKG